MASACLVARWAQRLKRGPTALYESLMTHYAALLTEVERLKMLSTRF